MARKSKYAVPGGSEAAAWKAALYIRLSREDGDKEESDSIVSQRGILNDYIQKNPELSVAGSFIDDGYTGTNFERPGFKRMMDGIKSKDINCVIVKDLSRLGRNYIEVGNYIEQIFPFLDVRFISVGDMLDSFKNPAQMNTVMVPFKNLMNDEYCRDISAKVRASLDIRRKQGQFIGAFASYGYKKDPERKGRLIIDEYAAEIVRGIFSWFIEGTGIIGIAKRLNGLGIPNPSAYKRRQGLNYRHPHAGLNDALWPDSSVRRILTNRLYTGDMVQGKNKVKSYKVRKAVCVPEENWIVVENTHEAVISRETFETAQTLLGRDTRAPAAQKSLYLLSGFVRCADCGKAMNRKRISQPYADYVYYLCGTFKKMSKGACTKHTIRADRLEEMVLAAVKKQIELAVSMDKLIEKIEESGKSDRSSPRLDTALAEHTKEKSRLDICKMSLYTDWKNGDITREEYHTMKRQYDERAARLAGMISRLEAELKQLRTQGAAHNPYISEFRKHRNIARLTRELVVALIDMIYIHEGGDITIQFRFEDEFKKAVEYVQNNRQLAGELKVLA
ncbi:MAG: recombinase family protein [Oscillospiraceae bacterium]|nr:recombinase family protein [Oscillospiraceae bacterium]